MKKYLMVVAVAAALFSLACLAHASPADVANAAHLTLAQLPGLNAGTGLLSMAAAGVVLRKDTGNGDGPGTVAEVGKKLKEVIGQVKNFGEDIAKKYQDGATVTAELKQKADESLTTMNELAARLKEVEQVVAAGSKADNDDPEDRSLGTLVIEDPSMKDFDSSAKKSARIRMDRKALTNVTGTVGSGVSAANSLTGADRQAGIVAPPQRRLVVRDLLMPGQTAMNSVEYTRETGFTNAAATVAEGGAKPYSSLTFDLKTAPVRTIAHLFKASRQLLDDAPALRSYIDGRARYGLQLKEESQLLLGDGTGTNILGLIPQATAFAPSIVLTDATGIDRLRLAILQAVLAEFPPNGFVLHPIDWAGIELTKDGEGRYIIGNPAEGTVPRLWKLPVVESISMPQGDFLTGSFNMAAQIFDRMEIEVLLSTENADDFEKNMVSIRAEERLALAVYRPESFITGSVEA